MKDRKDRAWLAAIGSIDECQLCGQWGTQVAHRNEGKGMALKCPDWEAAALCPTCHTDIDNGAVYTKDKRHQLMDRAIVKTLSKLISEGRVVLENSRD